MIFLLISAVLCSPQWLPKQIQLLDALKHNDVPSMHLSLKPSAISWHQTLPPNDPRMDADQLSSVIEYALDQASTFHSASVLVDFVLNHKEFVLSSDAADHIINAVFLWTSVNYIHHPGIWTLLKDEKCTMLLKKSTVQLMISNFFHASVHFSFTELGKLLSHPMIHSQIDPMVLAKNLVMISTAEKETLTLFFRQIKLEDLLDDASFEYLWIHTSSSLKMLDYLRFLMFKFQLRKPVLISTFKTLANFKLVPHTKLLLSSRYIQKSLTYEDWMEIYIWLLETRNVGFLSGILEDRKDFTHLKTYHALLKLAMEKSMKREEYIITIAIEKFIGERIQHGLNHFSGTSQSMYFQNFISSIQYPFELRLINPKLISETTARRLITNAVKNSNNELIEYIITNERQLFTTWTTVSRQEFVADLIAEVRRRIHESLTSSR